MSAAGLLLKTYPFILMRFFLGSLVVYVGYSCFMWGIGLTEYFGLKMIVTDLLFGYIGIALFILYIDLARKTLVHYVGYAHVAGMTSVLHGEKFSTVGSTKLMISRFGSVSAMYVVDKFMRSVVKQVTNWVLEKGKFIPNVFKKGIISSLVKSTLDNIVFRILEVIISYLYRNKDIGLWDGSLKATSLYVQAWKSILKSAFLNSLWMKLFSWILSISVIGVSIWYLWSTDITKIISFFIYYKIVSSLFKFSLVEPYQTASMLIGFYEGIKGKEPKESVVSMLSDVSDKFKTLISKGKEEGSELADKVVSTLGDNLSDIDPSSLLGSRDLLKIFVKENGSDEKIV